VTHWICSVSTCNRSRTRLVFCTVSCWDSHVAILRHRDAWAVEAKAPTKEAWAAELAANPPDAEPEKPAVAAPRRIVSEAAPSAPVEREILIVVSKMKKYIKDKSGMNCGESVAEALSDHVRAICDEAIRNAGQDERKTVLDRDVPRPQRR
jgi:histone H3/H4